MIITRVYNNGDRVAKDLGRREGEKEIEYNRNCRPGCAVFRDATCVQYGYLDADRVGQIVADIEIKMKEQLSWALSYT